MALNLPTAPTYTDYDWVVSVEHPDCYVAMYINSATWQISDTNFWRITTYSKTNPYAEINTLVIQYVSTNGAQARWSSPNERGAFVSQFDNVLWNCAPHRGSDAYDVTGGVISFLGNIPDHGIGDNWINGQTETATYIVATNQAAGIKFFTKTGTGTANASPAYQYQAALNYTYVAYNAVTSSLVFQRDNGDLTVFDPSTLLPVGSVKSAALPTNGFDDLPFTDGSASNIDNYWNYPRVGNEVKQYFESTGWYTYENIDPTDLNPYDALVVATGDVLGWWKCDEESPNTTLLDYSGNNKDMSIAGTYDKVAGLLDSDTGLSYKGDIASGFVYRNNMGLPSNAQWAFEGWIKLDQLPTSLEYMIGWGDGGGAGGQAGGLSINTAGLAYFHVYNTGAAVADTGGVYLSTTRKHHFVVQYTTTQLECWIDGVLIGTNTDIRAVNAGYPSLFLSRPSASGLAFVGQIDNAILYNTDLAQAEIEARYVLGATFVQGDYETLILADNPRAYFPLKDVNPQGEFKDIAGVGGFHAISANTAQGVLGGADGGVCAETNGLVGQYMQTKDGVLSNVTGDTDYTIEFWLQRDQTENNSGSNYDLYHRTTYIPNTGTYNHDIAYNWGGWTYSGLGGGIGNINLPDDANGRDWVHHVVTVNQVVGELSWWMSGVLMQRTVGNINAANAALTCILSNGQSTGYTYPAKGKWQHWAIYDYVLTDIQIKAHYDALRPKPMVSTNKYAQAVMDTNPNFYWQMDEQGGVDLADTQGNMSIRAYGNTVDNLAVDGINASEPSQKCIQFDNGTYFSSDHTGNVGKFTSMYIDYLLEWKDASTYQIFIGPIESGGYYMYTNGSKLGSYVYHSVAAGVLALSVDNFYDEEVIHHAMMFDGRVVSNVVNGYTIGTTDAGIEGYIHYPTYLRFMVGAQYGGGTTDYVRGKMAHLAQYTNPDVPPTEADYRKRFLLAMGYDQDNYTAFEQHVIADDPLIYFPMDDAITAKRTCAALYYRTNLTGNTVEPDCRTYLTGYLRQSAGIINDGSKCLEYTETTGVNNYILQRNNASFGRTIVNWSFEGWMNLSKVADAGQTTLVSYGGSGGDATINDNILYKLDLLANGSFSYIHEYAGGANELYTSPTGLFTFNTDQYVVCTRDILLKEIKLYINGLLVWTQSYVNQAIGGTTARLKFGAPEATTAYGFIGRVQHFAVHETALSLTRIRERYALGTGIDRFDIADDYATDVLLDAPVAYYRCNEQVGSTVLVDSSTFSNDGYTNLGTVGYQQPSGLVNAGTNKAMVFDGNSEIYIPDELVPDAVTEMSTEFWFKLDNATDEAWLVRGRDGLGAGWSYQMVAREDEIRIDIVTTIPSLVGWFYTVPMSVELGKWHYMAVVWDVQTDIKLYYDGLKILEAAETRYNMRNSSFKWSMGTLSNSGTPIASSMDEVAIYDSLLTDQTIQDRYIDGIGIRDTYIHEIYKDDVGVWWDYDRVDTGTVYDRLGNFNGSFVNFVTQTSQPVVKDFDSSALFVDYDDFSRIEYGDADTPVFFNNVICGEAWFEWTLETYGAGERILVQDGGTSRGWAISFYNGEFGVWIRDNSISYSATIPHNNVPFGQRNQVGWVINNGLWLYLNGELVATSDIGTSMIDFNGSSGTVVGGLVASGQGVASGLTSATSQSFQGRIGPILLYNSVMTDAQFKTHWDLGKLGGGYTTEVLQLNPVMWFRLDDAPIADTVIDSVNNVIAVKGTGSGNTMPTWAVDSGYSLGGLTFDGVADGLEIPYANTDFIETEKGYSIAMWVKIAAYPSSGTGALVTRTGTTSNKEIQVDINTDGTVRYFYELSGNNPTPLTTIETIPLNTWTHVAIVVGTASTGVVSIFINGVVTSVDSIVRVSNVTQQNTPTSIGKQGGASYNTSFFNGVIDEFMWFNSDITPTGVAAIYNATADEFQITGTVKQDEVGVPRVVRIYRRDNGALVRDFMSEADGTFDIRWRETEDSSEYFVIAFDDDAAPNLEAIARDRLVPNVVV